MNRIALCVAVLLLASGAWGQGKKRNSPVTSFVHSYRCTDSPSAVSNSQCGYFICPSGWELWNGDGKSAKWYGEPKYFDSDSPQASWPFHLACAAKQEKKGPPKKSAWVSPRKTDDILQPAPLPHDWAFQAGPCESAKTGEPCISAPFDVAPWHVPPHHRTCTDKKRVLLMSEDGVWHCYDFAKMNN